MKVLFLDMDGVVNHHDWWRERGPAVDAAMREPERTVRRRARDVDPRAVERLNHIVNETGCAVVLSSSWRHFEDGLRVAGAALKLRGATFDLLDETPDCARATAGGLFVGAERGAEIQEWLDGHPDVTQFAIVDDDSDMGPLRTRLVRTSMAHGLLAEHATQLIALLKEPAC